MTCEIDAVVVGLVLGKLREPELGEVPECASSNDGGVGCVCKILIWERAIEESRVFCRHKIVVCLERSDRSISTVRAVPEKVPRRVYGFGITEASGHGLIYVQHIDVFVPRPWVTLGRIGVVQNVA